MIRYVVRSKTNPSLYRSGSYSNGPGNSFDDAQFWQNRKSAEKEAKSQEEREASWSTKYDRPGSYMGPCEVIEVHIEEPA